MEPKDIADGLRPTKPTIVRVIDWLRRHVFVNIGRHGKGSIEGGVRIEF